MFEDLPRDEDNVAIIGDPRNDENMVIAGLHAAFLLFHNHAVDLVRSQDPSISDEAAFSKARRLTTWHYQWMILHEFLPLFVGQAMVDDIVTGGAAVLHIPSATRRSSPSSSRSAYRFGHTMVRPSYRANLAGDDGQPFFGMVFDPHGRGRARSDDLRGGSGRLGASSAGRRSSTSATAQVKPNKRIDTSISTPLFHLPLGTIAARRRRPPRSPSATCSGT